MSRRHALDSSEVLGAHGREYAKLAAQMAGNVSQKMKRLTRELREMRSGKLDLALGASAAIFVRHDSDRIDKLRAMITGAAKALCATSA